MESKVTTGRQSLFEMEADQFFCEYYDLTGKNFPPCYDELVHLPFFLHIPSLAEGGECDALCSTVDIAPTLLEMMGLPQPEEMTGKSLLTR